MADGRPRITVTSARTATASLVERRGEGVDRRAAHQGPLAGERLAREVTERRVERRVELPPPPVEAAVETVSAAEVLAGVAEYGPNYLLPQPAESKTARRKRLREDAAARTAGHAVVEKGTHVEILGEQRWWPGTITGREEGSGGRLVHAVEYDGYPDQDFRLNLEEETWRRVTLGAGGAAPTSGEDSDGEGSDEAADALPASATDIGGAVATGDEGSGVEEGGGEAGDAPLTCEPAPTQPRERRSARAGDESPAAAGMASGDAGATYAALGGYAGREEAVGEASSAPAALNWSGRRRVQRCAAMELLRAARRNEDEQREAMLPDDVPMLLPHGAKHSRALREVRRRLREYLSELAERGQVVPMMRTARGLHPTVRWTIGFGEWLALTRIRESKASRWLAAEQASARGEEAVVRAGRGAGTVQVMLDNMANHVWREVWPAMPADDKHYWFCVNKHVMGLFDGGGGGMHQMAAMVGEVEGRAAQLASAASGAGEEAQQAVRDKARAAGSKRTMEELRAATTHPCTKQLLYRVGQEQLQDVLLSEPFEVNVAIVLNAYICLARLTACRPGMATNDADDLAATSSHWRVR